MVRHHWIIAILVAMSALATWATMAMLRVWHRRRRAAVVPLVMAGVAILAWAKRIAVSAFSHDRPYSANSSCLVLIGIDGMSKASRG